MATQDGLNTYLARVAARARVRAVEQGALTPPQVGPIRSVFTDEARSMVADWQLGGGYERALAAVGDADPDLAVE